MSKMVVGELSRLTLGEKMNMECGDGDSLAVSQPMCSSSSDESQTDVELTEVEGEQAREAVELFKLSINKKKNIYETGSCVPLDTPWTFWVDRTERGVNVQQFEANLKRIYTVYTVHRFWGVYYNIPKPSDLQCRSSLHMMRDERKPVWEETYNCKGGTFRLRVQKKDTDKVWREMLMAVIGEQLNEYVAEGDEVCGVTVSIRDREDVILIWNTNAEVATQATVFDCVRLILPDTNFLSTFYKPHETHHAFEKSRRNVIGIKANKPVGPTVS